MPPRCRRAARCAPDPAPSPGRWVSPAPREDPKRSWLVGPDDEQLLLAPAGIETSVSSSHQARDVSTGPNRIHCHATISASSPAPESAARVRRGSANSDCTSRRLPRSASRSGTASQSGSSTSRPSYPAFHARAGPIVAGSALLTRGSCGTYGGFQTTRSNGANSTTRVHDPRCTSTSTPAHTAFPVRIAGTGTDVERGDRVEDEYNLYGGDRYLPQNCSARRRPPSPLLSGGVHSHKCG
jgi:hypothetical protein